MNSKEQFEQMQKEYINVFNSNWEALMSELFFQQIQFASGNRLRPYIVLVGYLASKPDLNLNSIEYDKISKLSLCIEIIHKSSLILDDLIVGDPARHGEKTFHIEFGVENTMMFAINLLSISVKKMNQFIDENQGCVILKEKGINLLAQTMYDMSLGELKELNLLEEKFYENILIKDIIHLETSPLIANSLLFGYYAGNGNNRDIEQLLQTIGYECGYIFQVMNDLEPFCQQEKLKLHKGRLNTDITHSKKNIALASLYNLISYKEKEQIQSSNSEEKTNELLIHYFQQYKIKDSFMREVELTHQNINKQIELLKENGLSTACCKLFHYFINKIINECKERLI